MTTETISISREEYRDLKRKAEIDEELLENLVKGLQAIQEGKVRRVR